MSKVRLYISLCVACLLLLAQPAWAQQVLHSVNISNLYISDFERKHVERYAASTDPHNMLPYFLALSISNEAEAVKIERQINTHCEELLKRKGRNDIRFLRKIFYTTQQKYLHHFKPFQPLSEIFRSGSYNCTSATALYAILLEKLNFKYEIKETPFHCYLLVHMKDQTIFFETTDAVNGFVSDPEKIREYEEKYRRDAETGLQEAFVPGTFKQMIRPINLESLCGLQYYNEAVKLYNEGATEPAMQMLTKGYKFYPSDRISNLIDLCLEELSSTPTEHKQQRAISSQKRD